MIKYLCIGGKKIENTFSFLEQQLVNPCLLFDLIYKLNNVSQNIYGKIIRTEIAKEIILRKYKIDLMNLRGFSGHKLLKLIIR